MRLKLMIIQRMHIITRRRVITALAMLTVLFFQSAPTSFTRAQESSNKSKAAFLTITIPGNYPLMIDDKPEGETTPNPGGREFLLTPGKHTIKILFPNNNQWTKEIKFEAGQTVCINLDYKSAGTDQSAPTTVQSPTTAQPENRDALLNITYPNGDKLIGNTNACRQTRIPKVPWWKRQLRKIF